MLANTHAIASMNIFMSGEHGAQKLPPPLSSLVIVHLFLPPFRFFSLTRYTGGFNRIDSSFDRQLN